MESGKHKKRVRYTVMIISDSPYGGTHPLYLKQGLIAVVLCLILIITAGSAGAAVYHWAALKNVQTREAELEKQVEELTAANQELTMDNAELSDKVTILSDTVTQNAETQEAQAREEEEKKVPKDFPLAGAAVILKSSETPVETAAGEDGETPEVEPALQETDPIVVFSASAGTKVVAAAGGVVASVEEDAIYGQRITIDHGNGYMSIYRVASSPQVNQGDEVQPGATLYEMQSPDERFGYQITQEGTLIDPLDLLEVYG